MVQVLVRHHVKKYEDFEAVFLGGRERRRRLGSKVPRSCRMGDSGGKARNTAHG
jgi:hypothetical protein